MDFIPGYEIKKYKEELSKDALMKMLPKRFRFHREPFWHQLLSLVFALQFDNSGNWYIVTGKQRTIS